MTSFYKNYKPVIVFYVLACVFSWPFFFWRDVYTEDWNSIKLHYVIKTSLIMWGPGISAILCWFLFKGNVKKTTSFFGTSIIKSLLFWGIPLVALIVLGLKDNELEYSHIFPLQILIGSFIYTLGEELGWRGFLQDQLVDLPKWKRYLLIGVLWELWHFTTRTLSGSIIAGILRPLLFIIPLSALSFLYGESVNKSKSLVVAVTLHSWLNIIFEFPQTNTYIVLSASIPFWIFMIVNWDKVTPDTSKITGLLKH